MVKKLVTWYKGFSSFQFGSIAATFSLDVVTARIIQTNFLRQRSQRRLGINYAWSLSLTLRVWKNKIKRQYHAENKYEINNKLQQHQHQHGNPVPVSMEESGPRKQSILRNKEVPKKNAPRKPFSLDVVTARIIPNFLRQRSQRRLGINYAWSLSLTLRVWKNKIKRQ